MSPAMSMLISPMFAPMYVNTLIQGVQKDVALPGWKGVGVTIGPPVPVVIGVGVGVGVGPMQDPYFILRYTFFVSRVEVFPVSVTAQYPVFEAVTEYG